ncbi:RICIN domain-containing protein [Micromonospora sp. NBC_01392]|uniref:RICIN domain-containing protein n=1 Tax=Micromonospora sp. NBC_01392 TaxID=2903588 RepID=UPI0032479004
MNRHAWSLLGTLIVTAGMIGAIGPASAAPGEAGPAVRPAPATAAGGADAGRARLAAAPLGPFKLVNSHSGKCLTIAGGSIGDNVVAVQYNCDAHLSRQWLLYDVTGTSVYHLVNRNSGKCLTIAGGSTATDALAVQYACDTDPSRRWTFHDVTGLSDYHIVNVNSGKCLTVNGASTANNVNILQFPCNTTAPYNERWYLIDA